MSLQYISDNDGQTTGVFIPIQEWNDLKNKFKGLEGDNINIPQWQKDLVRERIKNAKPEDYISWDEAEKRLDKKFG